MDETTRKKLIGKAASDLGWPEKCDKLESQVLPPMTDVATKLLEQLRLYLN